MKRFFSHLGRSRALGLALKLGFTTAAFWIALRDVDFAHLDEILHTQRNDILAMAALAVIAQILLGALRWQQVLRALSAPVSTAETTHLYYISAFFNCCLPGTIGGDVVRVWLARTRDVALPVAINSVIIDRILSLIALGLLVVITLPWLGEATGLNLWPWFFGCAVIGVSGLWTMLRIRPALGAYSHIRPVHWLTHFIDSLKLLIQYPKASVVALMYGMLGHGCFCLCGYALAVSMHLDITLMQCVLFMPIVLLVTTIPISIGGWGVREAGMVGMLGLIGVPKAAALMLSVQLGLINILVSLPAALLWLAHRRRHKAVA